MAGITHIIDYGMGNLRCVANALAAVGDDCTIAREPAQLKHAHRIVLPGVGAFGDAMRNLHQGGWVDELITEVRQKGKPLLGICLGMQILATAGTEHGNFQGLDWIPGTVHRIRTHKQSTRLPHVGWNEVSAQKGSRLYTGIDEHKSFYFVHSYAFFPADNAVVSALTEYDDCSIVASLECGNIHATQFHPEKSQRAGLQMLRNFVAMS
jgi:glutamine amidotransferase